MAREMKCPSQKKSNAFSTIRADWGLPCFQSPADCPAVGRKLRDNVVRRALKDLKAWLLIFANAILHNSPAHLPPCPAEKVNHGIRRVREATKYDAGTHCPGGHLRSQSWHGFHPSASMHPSYLCEPFLGQTTSIFGVFGWFWHGMREQKWSAESFAHILILKPCEFSTYGKRRGWIKRQGGRKRSEPQILLAGGPAGREFQQIRPPSAIHCSVFRASNHTTVLGDQTVWVFFLCQLVAGPPVDLLPAGWSVHQLYPTREKIWREKSRWLRRGQNVGKHRRYPNPGGQIHNSFWSTDVRRSQVNWSPVKRNVCDKKRAVKRTGVKEKKETWYNNTNPLHVHQEWNWILCHVPSVSQKHNEQDCAWKRELFLSKHEISRIMTSDGKRQTVLRKGPTNDLRHPRCKHPFCACFGAWFGSRFFCCEMAGSNAHICLLNGWVSNKLHLFVLKAWLPVDVENQHFKCWAQNLVVLPCNLLSSHGQHFLPRNCWLKQRAVKPRRSYVNHTLRFVKGRAKPKCTRKNCKYETDSHGTSPFPGQSFALLLLLLLWSSSCFEYRFLQQRMWLRPASIGVGWF